MTELSELFAEVAPDIQRAIRDLGWHTPTPVQTAAIPRMRAGGDLIVQAQTGSGKTGAFGIPLVEAVDTARAAGAKVLGIVGRDGGYTKEVGDAVVVIPTVNADRVTPHCESFQAVIWHLLVSDPRLMASENKWESTK